MLNLHRGVVGVMAVLLGTPWADAAAARSAEMRGA